MVLKVVIQQSTFNITYTFACVQIRHNPLSGGYCGEVPPLPIPNREVKLTCADGTAMQCGRVQVFSNCVKEQAALAGLVDGSSAIDSPVLSYTYF